MRGSHSKDSDKDRTVYTRSWAQNLRWVSGWMDLWMDGCMNRQEWRDRPMGWASQKERKRFFPIHENRYICSV